MDVIVLDARTYAQHTPSFYLKPDGTNNFFAFAAIGDGEEAKIVAHGYGATEDEAKANMEPCVHAKPKPRAKRVRKAKVSV